METTDCFSSGRNKKSRSALPARGLVNEMLSSSKSRKIPAEPCETGRKVIFLAVECVLNDESRQLVSAASPKRLYTTSGG